MKTFEEGKRKLVHYLEKYSVLMEIFKNHAPFQPVTDADLIMFGNNLETLERLQVKEGI